MWRSKVVLRVRGRKDGTVLAKDLQQIDMWKQKTSKIDMPPRENLSWSSRKIRESGAFVRINLDQAQFRFPNKELPALYGVLRESSTLQSSSISRGQVL